MCGKHFCLSQFITSIHAVQTFLSCTEEEKRDHAKQKHDTHNNSAVQRKTHRLPPVAIERLPKRFKPLSREDKDFAIVMLQNNGDLDMLEDEYDLRSDTGIRAAFCEVIGHTLEDELSVIDSV